MNFTVVAGSLASRKEPLVLGVTEGKELPAWSAGWPAPVRKLAQELLKAKRFQGKLNETFLLPLDGQWALLIGVGKLQDLTLERIRQAAGAASRRAAAAGFDTVARGLLPVKGATAAEVAQAVAEGSVLGTYRYAELKTAAADEKKELKNVVIVVPDAGGLAAAKEGVRRGQIVAEAAAWARNMVNRPANRMTPTVMAQEAKDAAKKYGFKCRVFDPAAQRRLGMNALLGVAKGSVEPSQFIVLEYKGPGSGGKKPLVFVGKGITFDSGGISIKPSANMEQMKYDMSGGAAVLGALRAAAGLKLPVHLVGLVPATENLPGGSAQKPGDVVKSFGGKTIEVINTDAEGRLVLADALGFAQKLKPAALVDLATLTGACVVALGQHCMGLMTNNAGWAEQVKQAAGRAGERAWELPLWPEYSESIRSEVADVKNVGDGKAGTITAAAFLKEFAGNVPWVHLDIAGVAWSECDKGYLRKGGTGVGVRLLVELAKAWKGKTQ